ncbi:MAG TPA: TonB-dependent receptor, partial [Terriglobales bacterium]|nr:TonB-dependent receptor [Terriglobales bacterium]
MDLPRLALGITCLLSGVATLCAQTPDLSHASLEELMNIKVYTASTYLQTAETAPSLVTVVTADQIRKYGYRTLADILRSVGGFYVTSDRNYSYVGVRGFARPGDYNTRILLLVDGHRLNDSVYGSSFVGFDALLDVDLIERVEIIRGPTSSLYGTNAFLAVVNVIPKTSQQIQGVELSTFLGSFGSYQGRATYGQTAAGIEMLVSATYYTSSGQSLFFPEYSNPTTNNGVARNADDERARNFYGQIGFGKFFLRGAAVSREKGIPTGAFGTVFNNPSTRTFDNFRSFDAQYHAPIARGWELSLRGSYDLYSYDGRYLWSDPTLPDPILNADGCRGEWWGAEASIYHQFPAHNKVTAGLEVRDDFRQDQFSYDVQPYWSYLDDKRKSWMAALYVQDEITLSPKIVLNLGFRHDRYSTFGGTTNPRAALIYQPGRGATLKFLYGTAFRAPSAYELYYRSFIIKNNPRLVPETIRT